MNLKFILNLKLVFHSENNHPKVYRGAAGVAISKTEGNFPVCYILIPDPVAFL